MPRRKRHPHSEFPIHIGARCINREWFKLPLDVVWNIMSDYLHFVSHAYGFRFHSFVLMSNHFHSIVSTPEANLSEGMNYWMREVSRTISREAGRINQTFGSPFYPCYLNSQSYFMNTYKYVYRNPVRAGLVELCEDWPYSTLHGLLGKSHLAIPLLADTLLFDGSKNLEILNWLNRGKLEDEIEIGRALRKSEFEFVRSHQSKKPVRDEHFIY